MTAYASNEIKARRIKFQYPEGSLDHLYADNDLILSHLVAMLSGLFPRGEEFFIESVKHYSDLITDPALKKDVKGFIGQEVTHGREHRILNERLQAMGYPTERVERFTDWLLFKLPYKRWMPSSPKYRLAVTAALEHYTASLAELILTSEPARELLGDSEVRNILLWHAYEESEHKAVAFDVYRTVDGTERMRINTMRSVNVLFLGIVVGLTVMSLLRDRASYNPIRLVKSLHTLYRSPLISLELIRTIKAYNRKGFHPNDFDATDVLNTWRDELFGEQGELVDHLK